MLLFTTHSGEVIQVKEADYVSPFSTTATRSSFPTSAMARPDLPSPLMFSPITVASTWTPLQTPSPLAPEAPTASYLEPQIVELVTPKPIIILTDTDHLPTTPNMAELHNPAPVKPEGVQKVRTVSRKSSKSTLFGEDNPASWMVYNEYGELVTLEQKSKPVLAEELTVTQALRLIYKNFHGEVSSL